MCMSRWSESFWSGWVRAQSVCIPGSHSETNKDVRALPTLTDKLPTREGDVTEEDQTPVPPVFGNISVQEQSAQFWKS